MNTQNDFLDNAVDDGVVTDGAGDLDAEMCSYIQNDTEEMCSSLRNDTHRMCGGNAKETYLEIFYFRQFAKHFMFNSESEKSEIYCAALKNILPDNENYDFITLIFADSISEIYRE